jgi:hypothetical protein
MLPDEILSHYAAMDEGRRRCYPPLTSGGKICSGGSGCEAFQELLADHDIPFGVFEAAVERVTSAAHAGRIPQSRLDTAVARIGALKRAYPLSAHVLLAYDP